MRLSVIIPGYENPSWRWFRCVDDGSRKDALSDFNDPRVRCVRLGENGGLSVARNAGLDAARGEYVTFVDSDDEVMDDVYAKTLAQLIDNFTLFGVKRNAHSGIVQSQVVLDDLFR